MSWRQPNNTFHLTVGLAFARSSAGECERYKGAERGQAMNRSHVAENDASRQRLRGLIARLTDDDLARPLGQHWTVSVALAHLAFWDRLWFEKFEEWERTGVVKMPPADTREILRR